MLWVIFNLFNDIETNNITSDNISYYYRTIVSNSNVNRFSNLNECLVNGNTNINNTTNINEYSYISGLNVLETLDS